jgi:hypothetical protein
MRGEESFFGLKRVVFIKTFPELFLEHLENTCFLCTYDNYQSCPGAQDHLCTRNYSGGCLDGLYGKALRSFLYGDQERYSAACLEIAHLNLRMSDIGN